LCGNLFNRLQRKKAHEVKNMYLFGLAAEWQMREG